MSDPKELDLGSGLLGRAKKAVLDRRKKLAEAEAAATGVKPAKKAPKGGPHNEEKVGVGRDMAAENRARLIRDLDARIAAARASNNMDLVNRYTAKKEALKAL
jgi:hypothetical protein